MNELVAEMERRDAEEARKKREEEDGLDLSVGDGSVTIAEIEAMPEPDSGVSAMYTRAATLEDQGLMSGYYCSELKKDSSGPYREGDIVCGNVVTTAGTRFCDDCALKRQQRRNTLQYRFGSVAVKSPKLVYFFPMPW